MLMINRRKGQRILIGDDIEIVVTEVHRGDAKLGIRAPAHLEVIRAELRDQPRQRHTEVIRSKADGHAATEPAPRDPNRPRK